MRLSIMFCLLIFCVFLPSYVFSGIKDLRVGINPVYHRLVFELDAKPEFDIAIEKDRAYLTFTNVGFIDGIKKPSTDWFQVADISGAGKNIIAVVRLKRDLDIKYETREEPFRVAVDFYKKGDPEISESPLPESKPQKQAKDAPPQRIEKPLQKKELPAHSGRKMIPQKDAKDFRQKAGDVSVKKGWRDFYMEKAVLSIASSASKNEILGYLDFKGNRIIADAIKEFKDGNAKGAIKNIQDFARQNPDSVYMPMALYLLGRLNDESRFFPEALANYDMAISKYPDKPYSFNAFMAKVRVMYLLGKYKDAADLLSRLPVESGAVFARTAVYERLGAMDKAADAARGMDIAKDMLESGDSRYIYLLSLAEVFISIGKFENAKMLYGYIQRFYPERDVLLYTLLRLGDIAAKEEKKADAEVLYKTIKEVDEGEGNVISGMAIAELRESSEDNANAIGLYKTVLEEKSVPKQILEAAALKIGDIYRRLGKYNDAIIYFKIAQNYNGIKRQDADSSLEDAVNALFTSLYNAGDFRGVINTYYENKRVKIAPENTFYIADSFLKLGLFNEAEDMYRASAAVSKDGHKNEVLIGMARLAIYRGSVKSAHNALSKIDESYKKEGLYIDAAIEMGDLYAKNSLNKEALAYYLNTLKNKDHPLYYKTIIKTADLYKRLGQDAQALESYMFVIENSPKDSSDIISRANIGIGDVYYSTHRFDMAAQAYEKALSGISEKRGAAWILYRLAESYIKLDKKESALKVFERIVNETDDADILKRLAVERLEDIKKDRLWKAEPAQAR